jgi:catalase
MTHQQHPIQTNDSGIAVESDEHSLTAGAGGPILLQDSYLIEQMANFNRERIAERQPHAKGSGAFGRFAVRGVGNDANCSVRGRSMVNGGYYCPFARTRAPRSSTDRQVVSHEGCWP